MFWKKIMKTFSPNLHNYCWSPNTDFLRESREKFLSNFGLIFWSHVGSEVWTTIKSFGSLASRGPPTLNVDYVTSKQYIIAKMKLGPGCRRSAWWRNKTVRFFETFAFKLPVETQTPKEEKGFSARQGWRPRSTAKTARLGSRTEEPWRKSSNSDIRASAQNYLQEIILKLAREKGAEEEKFWNELCNPCYMSKPATVHETCVGNVAIRGSLRQTGTRGFLAAIGLEIVI